jgi:N-acetylmuramoyl-L-alanine amidase
MVCGLLLCAACIAVRVSAATEPEQKRFLVVIDPAHGGSDLGSRFSATSNEKDVTLAFARRLRSELQSQNIATRLLRDGDFQLTADQRAIAANTAQAAIFISIHAALPTNGVRIFTALLPEQLAGGKNQLFTPWETAQIVSLERSRQIAAKLVDEFHRNGIAASAQSAPLSPLNSVTAPAIALELGTIDTRAGKAGKSADELIKADVQKSLAKVVASLIAGQRPAAESGH